MSGTGGGIGGGGTPPPPLIHGFEVLPANLDLAPTPSGTWTDTTLEAVLPEPGTYHLDAIVRAALNVVVPVNAFIVARLFDVTAGAPVADSEVMVQQQSVGPTGSATTIAENETAAILVAYTVAGSATIRVQAQRTVGSGAVGGAAIISDVNGRTTLRYLRVAL